MLEPPATLPTVLLSVKPHYADLIERGLKLVEFRRRFPKALTAARALLYVTAPVQELRLVADIDHVHRAAPESLWRDFSRLGGVERGDFDDYFRHRSEGIALLLRRVRALAAPLALSRLRSINCEPPQSLRLIPQDSPLLEALV